MAFATKPSEENLALARTLKRLTKGYTQCQVAEALGISQNTVSAWRNGRNVVPYKAIIAMGEKFGWNPADRAYMLSASQHAILNQWREGKR